MSAILPALRSAIQPAIRSALASSGAAVWSPLTLFAASEVGVWYDPSDFSTMFQDSAGTTPVTAVGDPVGKINDKSGNGKHATQSTDASRPRLGRTPVGGRRNLLLATDTLSTQNYTTTAVAHTLSFTGTGTVTLSGTSTAGPLVGTGVSDRVSLTFTPTAGTLTLTVSGSVTFAQLEIGSTATAYQKVTAAYDVTESGQADCYCLYFDGVDDSLATAAIDFSATDKASVFAGFQFITDQTNIIAELSTNTGANPGSFVVLTLNNGVSIYSLMLGGRITSAVGSERYGAYSVGSAYVASGSFDFSQATTAAAFAARINGLSVSGAVVDVGPPGIGNLGNYAFYIGRRGGSSFPLKGFLHSLTVLGRTATALEIAAAESYAAGKSGVTL